MQTPGEPVFCWLHREPFPTHRPPEPESPSMEQHALVSLHLLPAQQGLPVTPQGLQVELG